MESFRVKSMMEMNRGSFFLGLRILPEATGSIDLLLSVNIGDIDHLKTCQKHYSFVITLVRTALEVTVVMVAACTGRIST